MRANNAELLRTQIYLYFFTDWYIQRKNLKKTHLAELSHRNIYELFQTSWC